MINPDKTTSFCAYCDMTQDGGGWTVFQRRVDDRTDFYRGWADYVAGFGDLYCNLWAGLDHLHSMTSAHDVELHVYMDTFDDGEEFVARYSQFSVGDAASQYELFAAGYTGNAGDTFTDTSISLAYLVGMKFTTKDNDNDLQPYNCAHIYKGAWWYRNCHNSNLNGQYLWGDHASVADGINWKPAKGYYYSMKTSIMKIRRTI